MTILPPNSTPNARAIEALAAHVADLPVVIRRLWTPATCPAAYLPWLAWALSVDDWRSDDSEAAKRQAIADSPRLHRIKGTVAAVRAAIVRLGLPVRLIEWWQQGGTGQPYTAVVESEVPEPVDADFGARIDAIARVAGDAAPARVGLTTRLSTTSGLGLARVAHLNRPLTVARFTVEVA